MPPKVFAVLSYIPLLGWLSAFVSKERLVRFHTQQSMILLLLSIFAVVLWIVFGWLIALIPFLGPIISVSGFALLIAYFVLVLINTILGIMSAVREKLNPVPLTSRWLKS